MMRRLLTLTLLLGLSGYGIQLVAQQQSHPGEQPSSQQPSSQQPSTSSQTSSSERQSAQSFEGKITRSGNQLVFQDSSSQTSYQLDDQSKVAAYEGKNVKLMGTVDPKTNSMHVIDVTPTEK